MQSHTWTLGLRILYMAGEILPGYHNIKFCNLIQELQSVIVGTILTSRFSQLRYKLIFPTNIIKGKTIKSSET